MPINLSLFEKASAALENRDINVFTSLSGSSKALFFSMINVPCLLLCGSEDSAKELHSDAVFWSGSLGSVKPLLIPPAGDPLRPKSLRQLYLGDRTKIIASVEAAMSPIWPSAEYPLLRVQRHKEAGRDLLIEMLKGYGYLPVPLVSGPGELSVRGGIVDVFSPEADLPVRMEFFGDEIESIRSFDTDTQRTVQQLQEVSLGPASEPEEGPVLLDILHDSSLIINEPDDIKRKNPGLEQLLDGKLKSDITSLPIKDAGFDSGIRGTGGLGLIHEERGSLEDFVNKVWELRKENFILMVCPSKGQAQRLKELFSENNADVPVLGSDMAVMHKGSPVITTGELSSGYIYKDNIILTERDIFGKKPAFKSIKKSRVSKLISSIEDFTEGDYLVHEEHGIGRFAGFRKQKIEDHDGDFIVIEYLGGDRLYVPFERLNHIQKYHAPEHTRPKVDKLGGRTWQRTKQKVRKKIKDMAERLVALYARRSTETGHAFSDDTSLHREFDGFFLYEETPDQITAINEIKKQMQSSAPMDILLCGDVGYGKTEIVMRACFKAVYDSKQAAILVPTTILAEQHYETFALRFAAFPIKIDFLSRFKSRAEQKETLKKLENGDIDIVIGTHRLLAKDVKFYDLGLLAIDEEHRFGVTHKEKIKSLKTNVDILSLSATPIPRTLHMALSGIRSMSLIETPPEDRLAVRSFVARFDPVIIKEALQKELDRNGQVFFVHNRIHNIYNIADLLKQLVPESRVAVAHGQMKEKELEQVMKSFFRKETDILVSTAIIGAGLDIPSANTIMINRADRFGLADLYQLRGRVGRSNVRAYAYFLIPGDDIITEPARKKLQAIQELSYLGAGFRLALRDLKIRGAGNLLGSEQSGHIMAVGFDLYVEMLEEAVSELKGEKIQPKVEPVIDLRITALIPENYVENPDLRLGLYRRIASAKNTGTLDELLEELRDRFGEPPDPVIRLVEIMDLKITAKQLGISRIQNRSGRIRIYFATGTAVSPEKILEQHKNSDEFLKFFPDNSIELDLTHKQQHELPGKLKEMLQALT